MDWYYIDISKPEGKRRNGPWSPRQMLSFAEQGAFVPETLVWRDGFENWKPWSIAEQELTTSKFQEEAVEPLSKEKEEKKLPSIDIAQAKYASLGSRFCAFMIDSIIIQFIFVMLTPMHHSFGVISDFTTQTTMQELTPTLFFIFAITFIYTAFFVKNFSGTPGKIIMRLTVVRHDGQAMTWGCACLRAFAGFFSGSLFGIGCLLAAFDVERRTLHDFIANTRVLRIETVN